MIQKTAVTLVLTLLFYAGTAFTDGYAVHAEEFSADVVTSMDTGNVKGKLYFKNNRMNRNDMMGMITIMNRPHVYQIFTNTKKFHVSDVDTLEKDNPLAGASDFHAWAKENNMKKVGTESIEGFACDIYEGDVIIDKQSGQSAHMKFWLSRKLQYPLKTESMMPPPVGKVTTIVQNIKTGTQPAHLFELPKGYTEADSMEQAMGMPDMGQFSEGQMPSTEQMDEMMKKAQEMMKNMKQE
ncbi:MAG: DUF4412 domain-containing protein [Desulfotignum sp.]|nr:DUF4412 domain-containing protein [Desulfobacteraceae bacterium]